MKGQRFETDLAGRRLVFETGKYCGQANGAVMVHYGDTSVLATATMSDKPREGIDFFPLLIDYEERMYAVGKIPGGWGRREGKPTEEATIVSRMIDRPLRPLFPKGMKNDVQVVCTVMSVEHDNSPAITALIGASAALSISDIPFEGPVAGVHVGMVDGEFVLNPTAEERKQSVLSIIVAGTKDAIIMVEAESNELPEEVILNAIAFGEDALKDLVDFQEQVVSEIGVGKTVMDQGPDVDPGLDEKVRQYATTDLRDAIKTLDKLTREDLIDDVKERTLRHFIDAYLVDPRLAQSEYDREDPIEEQRAVEKTVAKILESITREEVRAMIVEKGIRPDDRRPDEIREITCEVGVLPRTHGTGMFKRGQTQVLTIATLGGTSDEQPFDGISDLESKRYMHHYNFPGYSVGEVSPMRAPKRREIGHGALAERALLPVLPSKDEFPYTIRLVSEVLESNGSSSQASVCGSTLALMDAGVPIKKPVAGIAMGLIKEGDKVAILSDIQGMEDALGDMDFKVAGTEDGVTAIQMDMKVKGLGKEVLTEALERARQGRLHILGKMAEAIEKPREELAPHAPRIITLKIHPDKIRDVIGPGGKVIKKIIEETGVDIDIEDDGTIFILSVDREGSDKAVEMIRKLTEDVRVGATYLGKVVKTTAFGAFVEVLPGKDGLVHISKLDKGRVNKVEDVVKTGDEILVKVIDIDDQGRINLSREAVLRDQENREKSH